MAWTWTFVDPGFPLDAAGAVWLGDRFCVFNWDGASCGTSATGAAWTEHPLPVAAEWAQYPAVRGGNVCTVGFNGDVSLFGNPTDGWTQGTLPVPAAWQAVTDNGALFVAVASNNSNFAISADGINWSSVNSGTGLGDWYGIIYVEALGLFVATRNSGWATSPDGVTWTSGALPYAGRNYPVWNGSEVVVITLDGYVQFSADAETWTAGGRIDPSLTNWFAGLAFGTDVLVFRSNSSDYTEIADPAGWPFPLLDDGAGSGNYWYGQAHDGSATVIVVATNAILVGTSDTPLEPPLPPAPFWTGLTGCREV